MQTLGPTLTLQESLKRPVGDPTGEACPLRAPPLVELDDEMQQSMLIQRAGGVDTDAQLESRCGGTILCGTGSGRLCRSHVGTP
jgi:hypothetical protein